MAIDLTKKPEAGGGGTAGGNGPRGGKLNLTKQPVAPMVAAAPAAGASPTAASPGKQSKRVWPWLLAAAVVLAGLGLFLWPGGKPDTGTGSGKEKTASALAAPNAGAVQGASVAQGVGAAQAGGAAAPGAATGTSSAAPGTEASAGKSGADASAAQGTVKPGEVGAASQVASQNTASEKTGAGQGASVAVAAAAGPGTATGQSTEKPVGAAAATVSEGGAAGRDKAKAPTPGKGMIGAEAKSAVGGYAGTPSAAASNGASALFVIHFNLNSATIRAGEAARVRTAVESLKAKKPGTVVVEAFTCTLGSAELNLYLSQRRSASAVRFIRANGIGEEVGVEERAFGEAHPIASNETEAGRKENRRVVVSLK